MEPGRDLDYSVRAIDKNQTLDEVDIRNEHNFHCYLPTPEEMKTWFAHLPQALANTEESHECARLIGSAQKSFFQVMKKKTKMNVLNYCIQNV